MNDQAQVRVSFVESDQSESQDLANDLADFIADEVPSIHVGRERADPMAQDFGATLVLVLGTTAITAVARGIAAWLARRQDANLHLRRVAKDGSVHEITVAGQVTARTEKVVADFLARTA